MNEKKIPSSFFFRMPEIHDIDIIVTEFVVNLVVIKQHFSDFPRFIPSLLYANCWMCCKISASSNQAIQNVIGVLAAILKGKTVDTLQVILSFMILPA